METVICKRKEYQIESIIEETPQYIRYSVSRDGEFFVLTKYSLHSQYKLNIKKLKDLKRYLIYVPKIAALDRKNDMILRHTIKGTNCLDIVAKGETNDDIFKKLFDLYRFCRMGKFDINYLPENFVFTGKEIFYISEEVLPQKKEHNLENYGLYYWVDSPESMKHCKEHGYEFNSSRVPDRGSLNKKIVLLSVMNW